MNTSAKRSNEATLFEIIRFMRWDATPFMDWWMILTEVEKVKVKQNVKTRMEEGERT